LREKRDFQKLARFAGSPSLRETGVDESLGSVTRCAALQRRTLSREPPKREA
jgi:hypothetical protein